MHNPPLLWNITWLTNFNNFGLSRTFQQSSNHSWFFKAFLYSDIRKKKKQKTMIQKLTFLIQTCLNISAVNNIRVDAFSFFMREGRCAGYTKRPSWDRAHIILSWVLIHWFFLIISIHLSRSNDGLNLFSSFSTLRYLVLSARHVATPFLLVWVAQANSRSQDLLLLLLDTKSSRSRFQG